MASRVSRRWISSTLVTGSPPRKIIISPSLSPARCAGLAFWQSIGTTDASYDKLTWGSFFVNNLVPVTIGNIIGGVFFVALVYWVIYLRNKQTLSS
jgi:hypothetical protein